MQKGTINLFEKPLSDKLLPLLHLVESSFSEYNSMAVFTFRNPQIYLYPQILMPLNHTSKVESTTSHAGYLLA